MRVMLALGVVMTAMMGALADGLELRDDGTRWTVRGEAIEAVIDHETNYVRSLRLPDGPELMAEGGGYWDIVYDCEARGLTGQYSRFGHHVPARAEVLRADDGLVHLCVRTDPERQDRGNVFHAPLVQEMHYVFERGLPGLYLFVVMRHRPEQADLTIVQARHVLRCRHEVFDGYQVSAERFGALAPWDELQQAQTIGDATVRLADGRIFTKYKLSHAQAEGPAWGLLSSGSGLGLWCIEASPEYRTGGPTKQDLAVQDDVLLLNEPLNGHCMGALTGQAISGAWQKVYGPWLYYVNGAASQPALWGDAMARADLEHERWPYAWCAETLGEEIYPLARGVVSGRILTADGEPAAGAWAILGGADPNWQAQSDGYRFWARCGADGRFRLSAVRPGEYTLYAWREGNPLEARRDGVAVAAGQTTDLEVLSLPAWGEDILWQIGEPDRTAREFRRGDDFRAWNILRFYPQDFPDDITFTVGASDERADWNIAQPGPSPLDGGGRKQHPWAVIFELDAPTDAVLTLGVADASYHPPAGIVMQVNGVAREEFWLEPGDSAAYRSGASGHYEVRDVPIPASLLRAGVNRIELTLPHLGSWAMYDFVALRRAGETAYGGDAR